MVEFRKARREDADDVLDFINYVFSQAHRPHDFKQLNPKMYDSDYPFWDDHFVAVEDGHIRATIAFSIHENETEGISLKYGHVGQVSVHPYHRGRGFMKELMRLGISYMRDECGCDYSNLGGLRQRYGYFGYMPSCYHYAFNVTSTNTRHVLAGREPLMRIEPDRTVWLNGEKLGSVKESYTIYDLLNMTGYRNAPDVAAAYFAATNQWQVTVNTELYETGQVTELSRFAETVSIVGGPLTRIFRFRRYIEAGLPPRVRAGLCADGELTLRVGEECFGIRVSGREVSIYESDTARYTFEPEELQALILQLTTAAADSRIPLGWFPLSV